MDKKNRGEKKRSIIQIIFAFLSNCFLFGFKNGTIYKGKLKYLCLPGLNCYSCPGAVASCPIGSLQAVIGSRNFKFSFYVGGFLIFIGSLFGRFVCGFLCPFGLFQDLIYKIPFPKKIESFKFDKALRYLKYIILILFVIVFPMLFVDESGLGDPWFCKWICPAGTLEGGVILVLLNKSLRSALGFIYKWKISILVILVFLSLVIYRPFCKYLCPLGGIYGLFNKISVFKMQKEDSLCVGCKKCSKVCRMGIDPLKNLNSTECIRCGDCVNICPTNSLSWNFKKTKIEKVMSAKENITKNDEK